MKNQKPNNQKIIFITVAIIVAIGLLFFWFQRAGSPEYKANYICPVNETDEIIVHKPELVSQIGRDTKYLPREDGSFVPKVETTSQTINGHDYSLKLESDKQFVNPYPGDRIKFTVSLLEDERQIKSMPTDEFGDPIFKYIQIFVGSNEPRQIWLDDSYSKGSGFISRSYMGQDSFIYYKNANIETTEDGKGQLLRTGSLDLSNGQVEFEYVWISSNQWGLGSEPYLDFQIKAGNRLFDGKISDNQGISTNQVLCFIDMFTADFKPARLEIQTKDEYFYYEVNTEPTNLTVGEKEIIKINITSRNTNNNQIYKSPLQRVVVYPLFSAGFLSGEFIGAAGGFNLENINQEIIDDTIKHGFDLYSNQSRVITNLLHTSPTNEIPNTGGAIDLIDGRGSVYFAFNGSHKLDGFKNTSPYLNFMIYPNNYASSFRGYKAGIALPTSTNVQPYRIEESIEIPTKPDNEKNYDFLYGEIWYERESYTYTEQRLGLSRINPLIDNVHTIISVPIDNPDLFGQPTNKIPNHLMWLITLNLTLVALGGFMIWHYKNRDDEDR